KQKIFTDLMRNHVGIALIVPSPQAKVTDVMLNGTMTFLETGRKALIITCYHVWQSYLGVKSENPDAILVVAGNS
ncbi:MAG: hypothetical protein QOD62_332, partial [Actinomycetota bacterium]|nr:hypothetical protein [Actinomycetota bacterium]